MSRAAYFKYLEETASVVGPFIEKLLQPYRAEPAGLYDALMLFARSRLRRPLQKPALFRLSYEVCGGKNWEQYVPIAAAFELLNISSYQANAAFDNKLGTLTDEKKDAQFISSMISRELAARSIRECVSLLSEQLAELENGIGHINEHIYIAQFYDLFVLNIGHLDRYARDEVLFLADYHKRCHAGSGVFNGQICYWGGRLAAGSKTQLAALVAFGEAFGTALQIANDIGDCAPTDPGEPNPRDYQDRYSDFRNGRLTAILYHLLAKNPDGEKLLADHRCEGGVQPTDTLESLSRICVEGGSVAYARKLVSALSRQADDALTLFGSENTANLCKQLASILLSNKYYGSIRTLANKGK